MDEGERIRLVQRFHIASREKLPNVKLHATMHVVVENQVAEGFDPTVRALDRVQREGLSRHDAVHAVASVLAQHMFGSLRSPESFDAGEAQRRLNAAIDQLTAESWRRMEHDG